MYIYHVEFESFSFSISLFLFLYTSLSLMRRLTFRLGEFSWLFSHCIDFLSSLSICKCKESLLHLFQSRESWTRPSRCSQLKINYDDFKNLTLIYKCLKKRKDKCNPSYRMTRQQLKKMFYFYALQHIKK